MSSQVSGKKNQFKASSLDEIYSFLQLCSSDSLFVSSFRVCPPRLFITQTTAELSSRRVPGRQVISTDVIATLYPWRIFLCLQINHFPSPLKNGIYIRQHLTGGPPAICWVPLLG